MGTGLVTSNLANKTGRHSRVNDSSRYERERIEGKYENRIRPWQHGNVSSRVRNVPPPVYVLQENMKAAKKASKSGERRFLNRQSGCTKFVIAVAMKKPAWYKQRNPHGAIRRMKLVEKKFLKKLKTSTWRAAQRLKQNLSVKESDVYEVFHCAAISEESCSPDKPRFTSFYKNFPDSITNDVNTCSHCVRL